MSDSVLTPPPRALPTAAEWRQEWVCGVIIDGVWVSAEVLEELAERPYNTEVTYQDDFAVYGDVKRVLIARKLAQPQTRGGVYAGPAFKEFWDRLEFPPRPHG